MKSAELVLWSLLCKIYCAEVFWFSKDSPTGQSERKKKKRQTEEEVER